MRIYQKPDVLAVIYHSFAKCYISHQIIFFTVTNKKNNVHEPLQPLGFLPILPQMKCYTSVTFLKVIFIKLKEKHKKFTSNVYVLKHTVLPNLFAPEFQICGIINYRKSLFFRTKFGFHCTRVGTSNAIPRCH